MVSFDETGEAGGATGEIYVRGTDGSPAVRLAEGASPSFSPDGKWVLGRPWQFDMPTQIAHWWGKSRPSHRRRPSAARVLLPGRAAYPAHGQPIGARLRMWVLDSGGRSATPGPEGATARRRGCISPDGKLRAARDPEGNLTIYPDSGGKPIPVLRRSLAKNRCSGTQMEKPYWWAGTRPAGLRNQFGNGETQVLRTFIPADPTGLFGNTAPSFWRDMKSYVYAYQRIASDLSLWMV